MATNEMEQMLLVETAEVVATARPSSRMRRVLGSVVLAIVVVLAAVVLFNRSREESYAYNGGFFTPPAAAAPLNLTDMNGNAFTLDQLRGDVALVYFGYTTCPDVCPTTLTDFQAVKEDLGAEAERVKFLLVTIDPERDTEAKLKEYLGFFDPEFIGLRGDEQQTERFTQDYGLFVKRVEYPDSATKYLLDHTAQVYAIDPQGRLALTFPYGMDPALIAEDIRHLLHG